MPPATIHWNTVTKSIRDGKCILFIGSEIFTSATGKTLAEALPEYLHKEGINQFKYYRSDNLFHFEDNGSKSIVSSSLEDFYDQEHAEADFILQKIVEIPFPLIFSLNADQRLAKIMEASGVKPQFSFYWKKSQPKDKELKPSKSSPVIYNVFGSVTHVESLILTYNDLFSYIQSILQTNTLPNNILTVLREATTFLFLGVPLNTWYVRFLLRVMSISSSSNGLKYAYNLHVEEENASFFSEQFNINVIFSEITKFVDELYEKCQDKGLVGRKDKEDDNIKAKLDKVKRLIADANMIGALTLLDQIVETRNNMEHLDQLRQFESQLNKLKKDEMNGTALPEEIVRRTNAITHGLLLFVNEILAPF